MNCSFLIALRGPPLTVEVKGEEEGLLLLLVHTHEPRLEILFINYFLVNLGIIVLTLSYYVGIFMIRLFYRILDGSRRKLQRLYKAPLI